MEVKLIRPLIVLGVPGVSLGFFYLLLRTLEFEFGLRGAISRSKRLPAVTRPEGRKNGTPLVLGPA